MFELFKVYAAGEPETLTLRPMRILLVDDQVGARRELARVLAADPEFEIVGQAGTVRDGVENAIRLKADLVLLDIALPDGSGFEALRAIMARRPECSVVVMASRDSNEHLFEAFRSGARGFALKDQPSGKLIKALHALRRDGEPVLSRKMTRRIIEEFSRLSQSDHRDRPGLASLTTRELEILHHLGTGATNREIAKRLTISENTVKVHVRNVRDKLQVSSRRQAASFARRNGLTDATPGADGDQ